MIFVRVLLGSICMSLPLISWASVIEENRSGDCRYRLKEQDGFTVYELVGMGKPTLFGRRMGFEAGTTDILVQIPNHLIPFDDQKHTFEPEYSAIATMAYDAHRGELIYQKRWTQFEGQFVSEKITFKMNRNGTGMKSFHSSAHLTLGSGLLLPVNKLTYVTCLF